MPASYVATERLTYQVVYTSRSRGTMRTIGSIKGSHGRFDGQPALGREWDYVENFPDHHALGYM